MNKKILNTLILQIIMSTKSPYGLLVVKPNMLQTAEYKYNDKLHKQLAMGELYMRGTPESHIDNIDSGVATYNRIFKNEGYGFGKKKKIIAV